MKIILITIISLLSLFSYKTSQAQQKDWLVRMAKIEVHQQYLEEYKSFLTEEIKASIAKEPGVLTLYAMHNKDNPHHISIVEIYANKAAYEKHIKTPHFLKYKNGTLNMIKSLQLIDMDPILFETKNNLLKQP
ncbi:MAG: antibiotic biosynthesis monooxygenase [Chitinophagaceae bacterium]|nr:MAG: antibiotic biosynthesis monooxygenase [Chitinophagaceae bacterium]